MNGYPTVRIISPAPRQAEVVARLMGGESVVNIERSVGRRVRAGELDQAEWILRCIAVVHRPRVVS